MNFIYAYRHNGFANSLWIWQLCYELSVINDIKVAVYQEHYPEIKYLNFPNTIILDKEPKNLEGVNSHEIEKNNFILPKNKNVKLTCGWKYNTKFQDSGNIQPVSKIKFYDEELNLNIEKFCEDKIGIHFRRGDHNATLHRRKNVKVPDSWYDKQCEFFKNYEFYLSTDSKDEENECKIFNKYKINRYDIFMNKKYKNVNCHTNTNYNILNKINEDLIKIKCIDLFALSRCKKIIGCQSSTFSISASWMGNNKELILGR